MAKNNMEVDLDHPFKSYVLSMQPDKKNPKKDIETQLKNVLEELVEIKKRG